MHVQLILRDVVPTKTVLRAAILSPSCAYGRKPRQLFGRGMKGGTGTLLDTGQMAHHDCLRSQRRRLPSFAKLEQQWHYTARSKDKIASRITSGTASLLAMKGCSRPHAWAFLPPGSGGSCRLGRNACASGSVERNGSAIHVVEHTEFHDFTMTQSPSFSGRKACSAGVSATASSERCLHARECPAEPASPRAFRPTAIAAGAPGSVAWRVAIVIATFPLQATGLVLAGPALVQFGGAPTYSGAGVASGLSFSTM